MSFIPMLLPKTRHPIEFFFLLAMVLSLPLFEVPKTIFWGLYLLTFLINRARDHDWGGPWDVWDTLFAVWLASPYVVALFAGLHFAEWKGSNDVFRIVTVAWMLKRSGYHEADWLSLLRMLGISTLLAVLWALYDWLRPHVYEGIQLHSVGHVSQSTIYLVIALTTLIAALCSYWRRLTRAELATGIALVVISGVAVVLSGSRAAAIMTILIPLILGLVWLRRSPGPLIWILMGIAAFGVVVYDAGDELKHKQAVALAGADSVLNGREPIWNRAWITWRHYPLFGVGINNFKQLPDERVREWVEAEGKSYDAKSYKGSTHAHSIYLTTLVERGLFGLLVLAALLSAWCATLVAGLPTKRNPPLHWLLWCGAASALSATAIIGLANTTLHHEHGLLSAMLLGMWLGYRTSRAPLPDSVTTVRAPLVQSRS